MKKGFLLLAICFVNWGCASTGVVGSSTEVTSEYDRFDDKTKYETPEVRLLRPGLFDDIMNIKNHRLNLKSSFTCEGESKCIPNQVVFTFSSQSNNWQYLYNRNLVVIIDGNRHDYGEIERVSLVGSGTVSESLLFTMDLETFFEFSEVENVELRLGNDDLNLTPDELVVFKNMAKFIKESE